MSNLEASFSILGQKGVMAYILKGTVFTLIIALIAVVLGIVIGSVLALCRNYCTSKRRNIWHDCHRIHRSISKYTVAAVDFICLVFCPCPELFNRKLFGLTTVETKLLFKAAVALILFTSSVIAEIIRGGLNSIAHGQFEAGHAQGFNVVQVMIYIILPQAYRNVIPTLLSQVITTIKDSSYLANVATIELMARTKQLLSAASRYNGTGNVNVSDVFVLFGVAALIYLSSTTHCPAWYVPCRNGGRDRYM